MGVMVWLSMVKKRVERRGQGEVRGPAGMDTAESASPAVCLAATLSGSFSFSGGLPISLETWRAMNAHRVINVDFVFFCLGSQKWIIRAPSHSNVNHEPSWVKSEHWSQFES